MLFQVLFFLGTLADSPSGQAVPIKVNNEPAQLDIRSAGEHSIRVTLKPVSFQAAFPFSPALSDHEYAAATVSLREIAQGTRAKVGNLNVEVSPNPLTIIARDAGGRLIQKIVFHEDGNLSFRIGGQPVLGMGGGGPLPRANFRTLPIEFDRRGRLEDMQPRWQSDAYGSRNPVP